MRIEQDTPRSEVLVPYWLQSMEHILGELNEGVVILDKHLRVVFANDALLRLVSARREEFEGITPDAIFPPKDLPEILRQHELRRHSGSARSEFYLPARNGDKIPAMFSGRSIRGPDGNEYVLLIVTDISSQKRIEAQLRASNALLQKRQLEMEVELALAARVQQSLAPQSLVWNDVTVETYYRPARTIGGDFGVVYPASDRKLSIVLCDVSGHGIGSALMANRIYSETLHQFEFDLGPARLLRQVHEFVHHHLAIDAFYLTMAAVEFTHGGHHAIFAAAGHPPAMLVSHDSIELLDAQSGILGSVAETVVSEASRNLELGPGDRLVLYSDGLTDVFNESEDPLGIDGLTRLVSRASKRPLPEMKQSILSGVREWSAGPLADDVSLVVVEVR